MKWLENRVPPPLVGLLAGAAMWGLAGLLPRTEFALRVPLAILLAVAGVAIDLAGLVQFRRLRTTVNPLSPHKASALVRGGIYRRTRNPMYLGMAILLVSWAVFLGSPAALIVVPCFVAYLNRFQIEPEERALEERFGADFARYRSEVRRWL